MLGVLGKERQDAQDTKDSSLAQHMSFLRQSRPRLARRSITDLSQTHNVCLVLGIGVFVAYII
jgi:hypothetical protein